MVAKWPTISLSFLSPSPSRPTLLLLWSAILPRCCRLLFPLPVLSLPSFLSLLFPVTIHLSFSLACIATHRRKPCRYFPAPYASRLRSEGPKTTDPSSPVTQTSTFSWGMVRGDAEDFRWWIGLLRLLLMAIRGGFMTSLTSLS